MNIKIKKTIILISLILIIICILPNIVLGTLVDTFGEQIFAHGDGATKLQDEGGKIVGFIQVIGTIISVAMLTVIGIKYVLGSAEEKAEYKKSLKPYLIGAILIFGFSNITQWIYEWAKDI